MYCFADTQKEKLKKNFIAVLLVAALAITVVCVMIFTSADNYYNSDSITKDNVIGSVTMTIRCDTVVDKANFICQKPNCQI